MLPVMVDHVGCSPQQPDQFAELCHRHHLSGIAQAGMKYPKILPHRIAESTARCPISHLPPHLSSIPDRGLSLNGLELRRNS
ncbi:hypothetical protein BDQ94DRAFT_148381 [Aspergillus welwitschiae]|uniref:Uncharacterized protein n=1 Tax=Aspergillus welwitschiae TaxID=1341132 RepID=A0A3F3PWM3_9EURO|nr:hypothetical protein BDQ94DRAFT_148381 [Aspergillus welwitschiae]RDH30716.1 hypothetical protein BDQ94DRAFT_148381 [Aspergillus welwitschiae]